MEFSTDFIMQIAELIGVLAVALFCRAISMKNDRTEEEAKIKQSIHVAARLTLADLAQDVGEAIKDGKITPDERNRLIYRARNEAVNIARSKGLEIAKYYTGSVLESLVERAIEKKLNISIAIPDSNSEGGD